MQSFLTPGAQSESPPADHSNRRGILLAANLQHSGPRDGLGWLVDQVWPKVRRQYSDIELRMVGGDDGRKSVQPKYPFVKWVASDQLPQLVESSRLFISPQRFGPPNLHVPAMLCAGLPGVVTTHAANCSGLRSGLLIADTPERFAGAIARLLEEKQLWGNLQFEAKMAGAAHSFAALKKHLSDASCIAAQLAPKPQPKESFSATLVDSLYAQLLEQTSGEQRVYSRLDFYIQLAEQLLRHGKTLMAREQLRHIFGWLGDSVKLAPPLAQPLGLLKRCYRQLGDEAMAESCANEARRCFTTRSSAMAQAPTIKRKKDQPLISLIVPTYNRLPILRKCLSALEAQTASHKEFEVIVIDDGSSDGTEEFMREHKATFRLQWLRQKNSGTGTARRHGVEHATGEYLLLMNDDTIFDPAVIEEHLKAQKLYSAQKWAVLGNFEYPKEARKRALTHFFCINSFMFPQVDMEEGCPYGYSHFITCNLSIRREAVLQVGSFDGTYMLSEDTEMGIKLFEQGYSVVYHPAAHAWHDHLQYAMPNLLRRARVYGQDYFYMFRKHPRVLKEWAMPIKLTGMDPANGFRIRDYVDKHRQTIKSAVAALERWDGLDFEPILADRENERHVLSLFQQSVPAVHWFYLFERMLEVMANEFNMPELVSPEALAMHASAR